MNMPRMRLINSKIIASKGRSFKNLDMERNFVVYFEGPHGYKHYSNGNIAQFLV